MVIIKSKTFEVMDGLFLIDLPQPAEGFEKFISAWFLRDDMGRRILVETGPAGTIPDLTEELSKLTGGLDYILLTHIHLDHSGGLGHLMRKYGDAKVLVSPRGQKHLISPEKLWNASVSTLGGIAEIYGEPLSVPPGAFLQEAPGWLEIFETPGHAPHHITFRLPFKSGRLLFIGEAVGMTVPLSDNDELYLRPTTAPKFDADAALSSIDLLTKTAYDDDILCFGHFGSRGGARKIITQAKEQMLSWIKNVSVWHKEGMEKERMMELLLTRDPMLAGFYRLPERLQSRERGFIRNSLQGIIGWVESQET